MFANNSSQKRYVKQTYTHKYMPYVNDKKGRKIKRELKIRHRKVKNLKSNRNYSLEKTLKENIYKDKMENLIYFYFDFGIRLSFNRMKNTEK